MEFHRYLCLFLVFFTGFVSSSQAFKFYVGEKDGWVLQPSENYNHWAERNRFQVNDTLFFKYKKGSDSVLVVSKDDYNKCNKDKPIMKMDGGDSEFKFDRSGPFFFISGNNGTCEKGQKLNVVVLAVRLHPKFPPPVPGAAPPPKGTTPVSPSPSPFGMTPTSPPPAAKTPVMPPAPAMAPKSPAPVMPPTASLSPTAASPTPVMTPTSPTPAMTPTSAAPAMTPISPSPSGTSPAVSPTPVFTPELSPSPMSLSPSPMSLSPSPMSLSPISSPPEGAFAPISSSPATSTTPSSAPAGDESPGAGNNPGGPNIPAAGPSSAPAVTPLSVFVSAVTIVLSVAFINAP